MTDRWERAAVLIKRDGPSEIKRPKIENDRPQTPGGPLVHLLGFADTSSGACSKICDSFDKLRYWSGCERTFDGICLGEIGPVICFVRHIDPDRGQLHLSDGYRQVPAFASEALIGFFQQENTKYCLIASTGVIFIAGMPFLLLRRKNVIDCFVEEDTEKLSGRCKSPPINIKNPMQTAARLTPAAEVAVNRQQAFSPEEVFGNLNF